MKPREPYVDARGGLHDSAAFGVVRAVERANIRQALRTEQLDRVAHFADRIKELGRTPRDTMLVVLNVDDFHGGALADLLMPDHDWQPLRDAGQVPYARGLTTRKPIQRFLDSIAPEAGSELRKVRGVALLAMDRGVVVVFDVQRELLAL